MELCTEIFSTCEDLQVWKRMMHIENSNTGLIWVGNLMCIKQQQPKARKESDLHNELTFTL